MSHSPRIIALASPIIEELNGKDAAEVMTALAMIVGSQLARPEFDTKNLDVALTMHVQQVPKYIGYFRSKR